MKNMKTPMRIGSLGLTMATDLVVSCRGAVEQPHMEGSGESGIIADSVCINLIKK